MTWWQTIVFHNPQWLWLFVLLPWLLLSRRQTSLYWPGEVNISTFRTRMMRLLPFFRAAALALLIIAIARPQQREGAAPDPRYGIDLALIIDVSESMLAKDFLPDRLEAAKRVAMDFVERRKNDRFCVTLFAGEAFSPCPLTFDRRMVRQIIGGVQHGMIPDNSAIGDGLAAALNRLKDAPSRSKAAILLSDGKNNTGYLQPEVAAEIARTMNVNIYTIGMGNVDKSAEMDEPLLQFIAQHTGGKYFRAKDSGMLKRIFEEINQLERTAIPVNLPPRTREVFLPFALVSLACILMELVLRFTILRSIP